MSNSNNSKYVGISPEQAAQALLAQGFIFDFSNSKCIVLHNDDDMVYSINEEHIFLDRFYGTFEVHSQHELAECRIEQGDLVLGPAFSRQIFE